MYREEESLPISMTYTEDYFEGDYYEDSTGDGGDQSPFCQLDDGPEWAGPVVAGVVSLLGLLGNGVVVVSCALYRGALPLMDVFLLNLALSDLLLVLALPLLAYNERWAWPMGTAACKLLRCCYSLSLYSGALLLACVSIDRYIAVVRSHHSLRLRTPWYGRVVCGTVWAAALLLSIPTAVFYASYSPQHHEENATHTVCELSFSLEEHAKTMKMAVPATQLAVGFFLPLCVMVFCYAAIALTLTSAVLVRRRRAVLLVLLVLAVFVLCHLPYNLVLLHSTATMFEVGWCEDKNLRLKALRITEGVAYLHCCLNPPLYAFSSQRFRTRLHATMCRLRPANHSSPSDHTPLSGRSSTASCTM